MQSLATFTNETARQYLFTICVRNQAKSKITVGINQPNHTLNKIRRNGIQYFSGLSFKGRSKTGIDKNHK